MVVFLSIKLNAFPLRVPDVELECCVIPYSESELTTLRNDHGKTYAFRRRLNTIQIFSPDGRFPVNGDIEKLPLSKIVSLRAFLIKAGILRYLRGIGRKPIGFNNIELVSNQQRDRLVSGVIGNDSLFQIYVKYKLSTRVIAGGLHLVIDCSTRTKAELACDSFVQEGFNLVGRYVTVELSDGYRKVLGLVLSHDGDQLTVRTPDDLSVNIQTGDVYLEASRKNFDDYIKHKFGANHADVLDKVRVSISKFNGGQSKASKIKSLVEHFQSTNIEIVCGAAIEILGAEDISTTTFQLPKPIFMFNDNRSDTWADGGITKHGPYTKRTFDRNNPSICIICSPNHQGRVEQFVRKFLKGIDNHKYFRNGLEGKFGIGTSTVEVFTLPSSDVQGYSLAIEAAISRKAEHGGKWDLALIQVEESFKRLSVDENPYYVGKNLFFLHQVAVQDFTIELLSQGDNSLGYSLNNMALASYAKMGGVPWLLQASPSLSHELVIGIGSANVGDQNSFESQRIMGITTVFSGDGTYIVSNKSKAVKPEDYRRALSSVLTEVLDNLKANMNWQVDDSIRLVFHASVKKFSRDEIIAVQGVIERYSQFNVEYAFLKVSEIHGLHMFDSATARESKGKLAPRRGKAFKLADDEVLVYLIGQNELKQSIDGHPRGVILSVHYESTFKDIQYLAAQVYSFSSHSWRSYFPSPMPVTISYSDLIARNLGWLKKLPGWNDSIMIGQVGRSQWFL
jgi:hypothetical protein